MKKLRRVIDYSEASLRLRYNKRSGRLTWRRLPRHLGTWVASWNMRCAGTHAGTPAVSGKRWIVSFDGIDYAAHQIIWLLVTGSWPDRIVDHKDRNPFNNSWRNLRLATNAQNSANSRSGGRYGKGVVRRPGGEYSAQIRSGGKLEYLGIYTCVADARAAYAARAKQLFGEFACFDTGGSRESEVRPSTYFDVRRCNVCKRLVKAFRTGTLIRHIGGHQMPCPGSGSKDGSVDPTRRRSA